MVSSADAGVYYGVQRINPTYPYTLGADSHRNSSTYGDSYSNDGSHPDAGTNPQHRGYCLS